jgi:hypothetical protein
MILPVLAGIALATPGIGILSAPVHARGTAAELLNVHSKARRQAADEGAGRLRDTADRDRPGGTTGWHSHPGPVLVTVKSGELTLIYADDTSCTGRTYGAGESFVDRGDEIVHTAINRAPANLELWATYLVPGAPGTPARIDAPSPGTCSF